MINFYVRKMINIVIPMAGAGSRFVKAGFEKPKPFIEINDKPMIAHVIENLHYENAYYYLIARDDHLLKEINTVNELESKYKVKFIPISKLTEGAACTVLYSRKYINNDFPLLIANSDQIIDVNIADFINDCLSKMLDGSILTFKDPNKDSKWSFAKVDEATKLVMYVKEKEAISDIATVGVYFFSKGKDFVDAAIDMIIENDRVNNEFYVCPVYNYLIKNGLKISTYNIDSKDMHGVGTPEDLNEFLKINNRL